MPCFISHGCFFSTFKTIFRTVTLTHWSRPWLDVICFAWVNKSYCAACHTKLVCGISSGIGGVLSAKSLSFCLHLLITVEGGGSSTSCPNKNHLPLPVGVCHTLSCLSCHLYQCTLRLVEMFPVLISFLSPLLKNPLQKCMILCSNESNDTIAY